MQVRKRAFDLARQVDVKVTVHVGWQTGLHTDFGSSQVNRFGRPPDDLVKGKKVSLFISVRAAEGAKSAVFDAYIGEVDVAIDDVGHDVADLPAPQLVSRHD